MDCIKFTQALGFASKEKSSGVFQKQYTNHNNYTVEIDFGNEQFHFGNKIKSESKTTQNFSQAENWVVLECVDRLLEKGYPPQNITLEKTYPTGHGTSGRLDILVARDDGPAYLMIECKTWGKEFEKELNNLHKNGGQLFTYFQQDKSVDILMLYASELAGQEIQYSNVIINIEEEYRQTSNVEDFFHRWNKLPKSNGIFEDWVTLYQFESKALTPEDLKDIAETDSSFIFNQFLEILRHNVVSDKPNAFNKIFTLFLCKIYDEKHTRPNQELAFQWFYSPYQYEGISYPPDDHVSFQKRLTDLYAKGMQEFLEKEITDISDAAFDKKYGALDNDTREQIKDILTKIRLEKNNEFAIKEVFNTDSFEENAVVVKEVVELLQGFKIRYTKKQQYLSDFFELLLTTGLKQESGQYFTPVPIAQFIIRSLPLDDLTREKLGKGGRDDLLPKIIDYASGSGHFITESMHIIQRLIDNQNPDDYLPDTAKKIRSWKDDKFDWALQYIYGIEKDYRLVKVGKVGCYLHGDGLAQIVHSDGLGSFKNTKEYNGLLTKTDEDFPKENNQFDVVISNPPYSVSSFKNNARKYYTEQDFEIYPHLTDDSDDIECLFVERAKQLLKDGGLVGIILPSSILSNDGIYIQAREIILKYFEVLAIAELGSNTFMETGTKTVTLFLRRRNNADAPNIEKAVKSVLENQKDVTINGIEYPVSKYVADVWESISFDDYKTLLQKNPNEKIEQHETYREYNQKIKAKSEKERWNAILKLEQEKILYFILTYSQKVVLIKTGEKNEEKRFLGYEFSFRRGSEGIHPIQRSKRIDECTHLYDAESFENPEKASHYVYHAFKDNFDLPIPENLQENISYQHLRDMLAFDRASFEKDISLSTKKVEFEKLWESSNLKFLNEISTIQKGKAITESKVITGNIPVIAGGQSPAYYHNEANRDGNIITVSASGAYAGFINYFNQPIFASDCNTIKSKDEDLISTALIFHFLKSVQKEVYQLQRGQAQPHVYVDDLSKIKIPLPPKAIQEKIVAEIEVLEQQEQKAEEEINQCRKNIERLYLNLFNKSDKSVRLSDTEIFETKIGKRALKSEIQSRGKYPVYSANVFAPFGYIDKELLTDFSLPSVVWGIDGDWMVNVIPANKPFYPTDHCGYLRIKQPIIKEKYLAYALNQKGKQAEFSRNKRASIDRVQGIKIPFPPLSEQEKIVAQIEAIESQIEVLENQIAALPKQKEQVLKKYLE